MAIPSAINGNLDSIAVSPLERFISLDP